MRKRALAVIALSLLMVRPGASQAPPVINGQSGAVTISPQTLDWLRQRLAEEEERLRQLQVAIQQISRAVGHNQPVSQSLVPTPAEAATLITTGALAPPIAVLETTPGTIGALPVAPLPIIVPHPPLIPTAAQRMARDTVSRPPLIPAPLRRSEPTDSIGERTAAIPGAPLISPLEPVTITPLPVILTEPIAIAPSATDPNGPVSITPPPHGPAVPTVTIAPPPSAIDPTSPTPGIDRATPVTRRPPQILIPAFTPNRPPSTGDSTAPTPDHSGSPVVVPPNSDGDDLVIPEGIVGSLPNGQPATGLRAGQSMAQVRRIKGTPALISRDDPAGTETWTYPDGTLLFRSGQLTPGPGIANAPRPERIARAGTREPIYAPPVPLVEAKRPAPTSVVTSPRIVVPSLEQVAAARSKPLGERTPIDRVAGVRQRIRTARRATTESEITTERIETTRQSEAITPVRRGKSIRTGRSTTSKRWARATRTRRWARAHRRAHRMALREATPRGRRSAMKACRKCRIARAYLRRSTSSRVAAWRAQTRTKSIDRAGGVTIIQRR